MISNTFYAQSISERLDVRDTEKSEKSELNIYPNPVTTFISLNAAAEKQVKKIVIFNLVGRKMKTFEFVSGEKYYVGDMPKGMYLVQLIGKKNQVLRTKRITKR